MMETLTAWCRERDHIIEPYGLDISPELADLARGRLPHWADRIFAGNAIDCVPPHRFDFVRTYSANELVAGNTVMQPHAAALHRRHGLHATPLRQTG